MNFARASRAGGESRRQQHAMAAACSGALARAHSRPTARAHGQPTRRTRPACSLFSPTSAEATEPILTAMVSQLMNVRSLARYTLGSTRVTLHAHAAKISSRPPPQQRANVRRAGLLERGTTRPAGQRQREQQRQVRTWRGDPNTGCRAHSTTCSPPCCPCSRRPCPPTASTTGPPAATPPRVPRKRPGLHAQRGGERRQPAAAASWFRQAACHPACSARLSPSPRPPPGPLRRQNSRGGSSLHSRDGRDQKGRVIRGGTYR